MDDVLSPSLSTPSNSDRALSTVPSDAHVQRRRFLRGGALLAAATGGVVAASVTPATVPVAAAADGDVLHAGAATEASSTTSLTLTNPAVPALTLTNPNGPALLLTPSADGFTGQLPVGGLAGVPSGVLVGLEDDQGKPFTSFLVTAPDLSRIPITLPFGPGRVLNTKDEATLDAIVASSSNALDSKSRLKKGAWIDVAVLPTSIYGELLGAFLTLTSVGSTSGGSLTACNPSDKPDKVVTLPFDKNATVATGTVVQTATVGKDYCVRVYATATTHLKLDVTGFTYTSSFGGTPNAVTGPDPVVRDAISRHLQALNARARS